MDGSRLASQNFDVRKGMEKPGGGDIVTGRAVAPGVPPSTMAVLEPNPRIFSWLQDRGRIEPPVS